MEPKKSKGHVAFFTDPHGVRYELYLDGKGDLWRAPNTSVISLDTGMRIGRWEAPAHMAQDQIDRIVGGRLFRGLE